MDGTTEAVPLCPNRREASGDPGSEAFWRSSAPTYTWVPGGLEKFARTSMDGTTEAVPLCPNRREASGGCKSSQI